MNNDTHFDTRDLLLELGFRPDAAVMSTPGPGLSFDFGNLNLQAAWVINLRFQEVVLFTGVLSTPRTVSDVEFEMPRQVASREQCAAWLVWHLDRSVTRGVFHPSNRPLGWPKGGETRACCPGSPTRKRIGRDRDARWNELGCEWR